MSNAGAEFDNSYVTIQNEVIDIHYRKTKFRLAIDKVAKIYLAKKKSKYSSWIPGITKLLDNEYNLYIKTSDNQVISMDVKSYERQFFIGPIAMVRKLNQKNNEIPFAS